MKRARIEYQIEGDTRVATFEADGVVAADFPPVPVLMVQVEDAEDADALVALIEKHDKANGAPKKRKPRTSAKLPPSPKCIVAGCEYDADTFATTDSDLCRDHASASADEKYAWRTAQENAKKPTPAPVAAKKARGIRQQLEGGATQAETGSAPGPRAA